MTFIVAVKDQISSFMGDESVILNIKTGIYYGLNSVGARIWQLVEKPVSIEDIVETVINEFDTDDATCQSDVTELIDEMLKAELIELIEKEQ